MFPVLISITDSRINLETLLPAYHNTCPDTLFPRLPHRRYNQSFDNMPDTPEARARQNIDQLLTDAGWIVQSRDETNITAGRGVAIREFPMKSGYGEADYLL